MTDYRKPIPETEFLSNKLPVPEPSDEEMVYLDDKFLCESKYYRWTEKGGTPLPGSSPSIMCRKTVYEMLKKAESFLPEGYRIKIFDAYRTIAVQTALWNYFRKIKEKENPGASSEEIDRQTLFCISYPSYDIFLPCLHNTGGSVDLTIVGPDGSELNMGSEFDEFTERAWTSYYEDASKGEGKDKEARENRRMLYNVMYATGFTNLPSEWWHFDYGNEKWGQYTGNVPIYGGILDAQVRNTVPYENMEMVRDMNEKEQKIADQIRVLRTECRSFHEKAASVMIE